VNDVVLQIHGLKKSFGHVAAVDGIDLTVRRGEIFGFLGPNGAGKTTTISMMLGLLQPTAGDVEILGQSVTPAKTDVLRRVGSLVGEPGLLPYLSARQNLRLLAGVAGQTGDARVEQLLDRVGLVDAADRRVEGYSTGMKQRLGLAAALLHKPDLLLLDEPTSGLDPGGMREMRRLLRSLAQRNVTVFLSSHLLHEVQQICDRVAVLNKGRIVTRGRVDSLLSDGNRIRVSVPSPATAARVLRRELDISHLNVRADHVELSGVPGAEVVRHLSRYDIYPSEVRNQHSDLEALFLESTRPAPRRPQT
jgi:ABC-2 type transport system ATP-binding protein